MHNRYFLSFDSGSGQTNLRKQEVLDCPIIVPPLSEQEKIAEVLSDTDLWIESTEALLAKKRQIKKGAMQKLLSPKEDWEVRKLGEVAEYRRGSFPQPYGLEKWYDEHNGMPFVQVFDVAKNMKLKSTTKQRISDLFPAENQRKNAGNCKRRGAGTLAARGRHALVPGQLSADSGGDRRD